MICPCCGYDDTPPSPESVAQAMRVRRIVRDIRRAKSLGESHEDAWPRITGEQSTDETRQIWEQISAR